MDYKELFGAISVIISVVGYAPYLRDVYLKRTKPHVFSWIVFCLIGGIGCLAQVLEGAGAGSWTLGVGFLVSAFIVVGAWKNGEKNITKSDWIAFGLSLSIIPIWVITKDPTWAVILVSIIYSLGFIPTIRKSYNKPHEETLSSWIFNSLKFIFTFFALEHVSFVTAYLPAYLIFANGSLAVLLIWRRRMCRAKAGEVKA